MRPAQAGHPAPVSIGPLPEGSGDAGGGCGIPRAGRGFNGAASRRKRRFLQIGGSIADDRASMEPLPEGSGDAPLPVKITLAIEELQWSRFPKEAEMGKSKYKPVISAGLQWSRFPKEAEILQMIPSVGTWGLASMEPLPEGSGDIDGSSPAPLISQRFNGAASRRKRRS